MIRSYRDKDTERLAAGERVRQWEPFRQQAEKRLRILDAATSLGDLAALNSNRLEALKGKRNVTADTALRLSQYFGMSADFWMNLQSAYELDLARQQLGKAIQKIPRRSETAEPRAPAA